MSWALGLDKSGKLRLTDAATGKNIYASSLYAEWGTGGSSFAVVVQLVEPLVTAGKTALEIRDLLVRGQHVSETDVMLAWFAVKLGIAP